MRKYCHRRPNVTSTRLPHTGKRYLLFLVPI